MIQTRAYEFMVQYTPQREWVERRGILFWLAFFFIELGAGMFIVASIFGNLLAMAIGFLICAILGGGLHLLYLGKPLRFWRIFVNVDNLKDAFVPARAWKGFVEGGWKTSWISRGMYFISVFLLLAAIYMGIAFWGHTPILGLLIAASIFAFLAVLYGGLAMAIVNGLQMWNSPMLPLMFVVAGIWGGIGLTIVTALTTGATAVVASLETWTRLFLIGFIIILLIYLWSIRYLGLAGKTSVRQIVGGRWAPLFWVMVILLGMIFPLVVALLGWVGGMVVPVALIFAVILFELLGDLFWRYCILRTGYYHPLIPTTSYEY